MTVRNIPAELAQALDKERRRRGLSLDRTVLALLCNALGVPHPAVPSNGLRRLAGGWSEAEYRQFEKAVRPFEDIDQELWQ